MELGLPTLALATLLVFAVSVVFAAMGLGGGMLYVPILTWLGLPLKTGAIPLGLLLNGLNTLLAFLRYWREGLVDFRGGAPAALAAVIGAPLGAQLAHALPTQVLLGLFALGLLVAGGRSLAGGPRRSWALSARLRLMVGAGTGAVAGFVGGLLGLGGGFIVAPLLMELGYEPKRAAATTAFIVTVSSFSGLLGHAFAMQTDWTLFALLGIAVLAGSQLGAWLMARHAKPSWIKRLYGVLLLGVAAKIVWDLVASSGAVSG